MRDTVISQILDNDPTKKAEVDYLIRLAEKNVCEGIIEEPRVFYDSINIDVNGLESRGDPDVFFNGEQFPVRLTKLTAALRLLNQQNVVSDERMLQRVGLQLTFHDQAYMNRDFVPIPLWSDIPSAASDVITFGTASWRFDRPNILSTRDTLRVTVQLEQDPGAGRNRRVTVSFTGVGLISRRPYFFSAELLLTTAEGFAVSAPMSPARYRSDGTEPIAITDMTCHCGSIDNANDAAGDIRQLRVQVRQIGNGTNADWFVGPVTVNPLPQCPAVLLGITTGRCVVHHFPGEGLLWEPGEGITVAARQLEGVNANGAILGVALSGYISVT